MSARRPKRPPSLCEKKHPPPPAPPPNLAPASHSTRSHGAPPPSSFPSHLQTTSSSDRRANRISRTELDFEEALRAGDTFVLKEGPDLSTLGADSTSHKVDILAAPTPPPTERRRGGTQPPRIGLTPSTPRGVPPSAAVGDGSGRQRMAPAASTPSVPVTPTPADPQWDPKRRSMYRGVGTASSPDLATLVKKQREKGIAHPKRQQQDTPLPPLPVTQTQERATRPRSSTSSAVQASASTARLPSSRQTPASPEWVVTDSRPSDSATMKNAKGTMGQRAAAMLGKLWGQNQKPAATLSTPSPASSSVPPVPPLPMQHRQLSAASSTNSFASGAATPTEESKPFSPVAAGEDSDAGEADSILQSDDASMVVIEPPQPMESRQRSRSPGPTLRSKESLESTSLQASFGKRRSMSVGDLELKNIMNASSAVTPLPSSSQPNSARAPGAQKVREKSWNVTDFINTDLAQFDTTTSTFSLQDPATPQQEPRRKLNRTHSDNAETISTRSSNAETVSSAASGLLHPSTGQRGALSMSGGALLPRTASIKTPARSRSGSHAAGMRPNALRSATQPQGHTLMPARSATQLRTQRGVVSASEPSLVPPRDDSKTLLSPRSQQDMNNSEHSLHRWASSQSLLRNDDDRDIEERGKELAMRCWREDEEFLVREKIAEFIGGHRAINAVALRHYMDLFDFSTLRLDQAFRRLCAKLFLKAETQQVDRILVEFARRYHECNPDNLFGSSGVVHAVSYSMLLLNTDLHIADLATHMSRGQFVRNTLNAIQVQIHPERYINPSTPDLTSDDSSSVRALGRDNSEPASTTVRSPKRSGSITSWNSVPREVSNGSSTPLDAESASSNADVTKSPRPSPAQVLSSGPTVGPTQASAIVYDKHWELEMENLLKDMYAAIKSQQILQPLGNIPVGRSSTSSLTPGSPHGMLKARPSVRGDRITNIKRGSFRGIPALLNTQQQINAFNNSSSSVEGRTSPAPSYATSLEGQISPPVFAVPAIGFASNLTQTIIRETHEDDNRSIHSNDSSSSDISITDEELALLGPPWAKEGILCRKQFWESKDKKAKSRNWMDVFVVISKGELSMFTFGEAAGGGSGAVGGGNWLTNATPVGSVSLAHSLSHALPPPGYNRQRPHCMVLTLANGGVYFFQAGTDELVSEWTSTCNYWAARQSKEPLAGGVSNMEYGWNRVLESVSARGRSTSEDAAKDNTDTASVRSGRSGRSKFGNKAQTVRSSPWTDRILINDWKQPITSTVASTHDEGTQLDALRKHARALKQDLKQHNDLQGPMTALYRPGSNNAIKAETNWKAKSQYLLAEIIKYESYIESLQSAITQRSNKRMEKALEKTLSSEQGKRSAQKQATGGQQEFRKMSWKLSEEDTIVEGEEPPPTPQTNEAPNVRLHRRGGAEGE